MPDSIGRFHIMRELGKGAQGTVYLARDPHLERQVAIKTLHPDGKQNTEMLLKEARIVSKLQHPDIVALFDAGEHEGTPYLVYAYVEGQTLAQVLRQEGKLPLVRAARITCDILDGMAYAHRQGVIHRDIKPANIMINTNGQPLVMDFGIARNATEQSRKKTASGTPHYMAPEIVAGKDASIRSDIFAVGMMLYEMVTGAPAASGDSAVAIMHHNVNEVPESPVSRNLQVDERLESIILKAIAKKPEDRYADATAMRQALLKYLDPMHDELHDERPPASGESHSTLEFLMRIMRRKSDFPALSNTISEVNKAVESETESAENLTQTILRDFALTNKLLKLVNTASYGQYGGKINTVSKAVVILGFETIRNVAMSLILLEFLQNKSQAAQLKDDVVSAFFAGAVASQLATGHDIRDAEEAVICAMFQNLGRLLATFYFFEESQEVARMVEQGVSESAASRKVLGINYDDLGIGVAKSWNFPARLLAGMKKLPSSAIARPRGELDQLSITVNLANELCATATHTPIAEKNKALKQLATRYSQAYKTSERQLSVILEGGLQEVSRRAAVFNIPAAQSPLLKKISAWNGQPEKTPAEDHAALDTLAGITQLDTIMDAETETEDSTGQSKAITEAVLSAGIQDVTNTLVEDFNLNDILQMVLETMYRGMSFNRALIFVRDSKTDQMVARFGFGHDIEEVLPKFRFSLTPINNIFSVTMDKGTDIMIEDVTKKSIAFRIPAWHRDTVSAQSFLLLPVMINGKAIALFYADMEAASSLKISQRQLSMLRTLRNQAVLAIKQKQ